MADKKKTEDGYVAKGTYFDAGLSDADRAAVEDLSRQWKEYQAAGDQAGMDKTHQQAEAIRSGYGYSGGGDGSEYIPIPREEQKASTPGDWIGGDGTALGGSGKGSVGSWGGGRFTYEQAPEYASKYQKQIDELTAEILGRPAFEYDPFKDPTYQQYEQSYREGGKRAMQDTLGQASARSGGLASSYADRVSQQTYDQYMSELADKIPELKQLAYEMYLNELNGKRADLSMLTGLDDSAYNKFLTSLGQYNADRSFDYGMFGDAVGRDQWQREFDRGVLESDRDFLYGVGRDQIADERYGTEWDYKVQQDALSRGDQDRQEAISRIYNYLQAGGTVAGLPQDLVQGSGLSTMELEALAADFAKQRSQSDQQFAADLAASKAATAAKYKSSGSGSGGGGGGKPKLTAAQTLKAIGDGIINEETVAPYRYWYGEDLDTGSADGPDRPDEGDNVPMLNWENQDSYGAAPDTVTMDLTGYAADLYDRYESGEIDEEELADLIEEDRKNGRLRYNEANEILRRLGV